MTGQEKGDLLLQVTA